MVNNAIEGNKLIRGFLFACTNKSETECATGPVFGTDNIQS